MAQSSLGYVPIDIQNGEAGLYGDIDGFIDSFESYEQLAFWNSQHEKALKSIDAEINRLIREARQ